MHGKIFFPIFFLLFFSTCSHNQQKAKEAELRLKEIELLISEGGFNTAKQQLDSIHLLFPKLISVRKAAISLEDSIIRKENIRNILYLDSILPLKKEQLDSLQKMFRFEKDVKYQTTGIYIYHTLQIEANAARSYLRAYVDEEGNFFLTSHFAAKNRLEHTRIKASIDNFFTETAIIPIDAPQNHYFSEDGKSWEIVSFKNELAAEVPSFIAQHTEKRIKISLEGKKEYSYYLTERDKKALQATYKLGVAQKEFILLKKEEEKARKTLKRLDADFGD